MQEAERSLPGYDETVVTEHLRSAGANWIVVDAADYPTFDGWHMQRPVAERLSHDVGRHLATLTR
jgi:hypothetical protein